MRVSRALRLSQHFFAATLALSPAIVQAQQSAWKPTQPVELISSTGVGGAQDRLARTIQAVLESGKLIPAPAVVVNKPGGSGALSVAYLNQHAGDGHYVLLSSALMLSNHIMGKGKLNYTDITPIAQLFHEYSAVVVKVDSPIKTGADLIARMKASPESVSIGTTVLGTSHHLSIAKAVKAAGLDPRKIKIVNFKSGTDAITATMGGHITATVSSVSNAVALVKAGSVRIVAVSAPKRLGGDLAEVPTWKELGYESVSSNFRTVFGARGLAPAPVQYWEQTMLKVAASPAWLKQVENNYWVSEPLDSAATRQYLNAEYKTLQGLLGELGLAKQ